MDSPPASVAVLGATPTRDMAPDHAPAVPVGAGATVFVERQSRFSASYS